ncbi:hypothetical protein [Streptomyces sp. SCL15-4]|uniref:hypothetical protein n=1 Tax=Streptomyces sp. SCL15-4 TaxID=2967221 RepID=UPI0029665E60|nr:hypothetical protein [Streptomyces sp. SCL15-4]
MTDTWNGEPLADAKSVNEDIHYRIHDADSGALLGFGTGRGGALGAVVAHCRRVEDAQAVPFGPGISRPWPFNPTPTR